ncbi:type IV secretory system conjugative DNA transfer family protein [Xanthobacter autotrophicus]|uniref:type IV secretory system conjugative DNA transfer family protein n=1 Tax=Xanthobacter TaxID=279 RepID=UPI0024AC4C7B|nr:type IV secretory system conjugative DNA transfer family protein [Xanthobacter autotrophicus]MDI4665395.1 type IV secretory system conjugative DNA transfer family protein [Xanthobacter autotrophicus]
MPALSFNEEFRFGSARWADAFELKAAGLFEEKGLPIGFFGSRSLALDGDAPLVTIGGAGSGKLRDIIGHIFGALRLGQPILVLDPRGEIAATFLPALAHAGIEGYLWNPFGLHGLPSHRCNPLDPIDPNSPAFHADCKLSARSLVTVTSKAEGKYFEQRGSGWVEAILKRIAEVQGSVSLPDLMEVVNVIESDGGRWADFLEGAAGSAFDDVRRIAGEMIVKQQDSPREFGSIMGEVYGSVSFLDDPTLRRSLESPDFSLSELVRSDRTVIVFLMMPAEYLHQSGPVLRQFFTAPMLYKSRNPGSGRLLMLIDEAAQLGSFQTLQQLYTYGRGIGIRPWTFWQDIGQMVNNFGPTGVQTFLGSSQMRQFFGVRDYQTARLISDMLGTETLEYDDTRLQEEARRRKIQAIQQVMEGGDPFKALLDAAHYGRAQEMRSQQARKLMTEDEILSLPENRQILFLSGKDLPPILANKIPYFERREMAGLYLPNPYHPPRDRVRIATRFGSRWRQVVREPVPSEFSSFAQYRDGTWAYVEGHKP